MAVPHDANVYHGDDLVYGSIEPLQTVTIDEKQQGRASTKMATANASYESLIEEFNRPERLQLRADTTASLQKLKQYWNAKVDHRLLEKCLARLRPVKKQKIARYLCIPHSVLEVILSEQTQYSDVKMVFLSYGSMKVKTVGHLVDLMNAIDLEATERLMVLEMIEENMGIKN